MHLLFARLGDDWQTSFNLGNLLLINARPYLLIRNGCYVLLDFCSSAQGQKRMTSIRTLSISDASLINVLSASTFMHYLMGRSTRTIASLGSPSFVTTDFCCSKTTVEVVQVDLGHGGSVLLN